MIILLFRLGIILEGFGVEFECIARRSTFKILDTALNTVQRLTACLGFFLLVHFLFSSLRSSALFALFLCICLSTQLGLVFSFLFLLFNSMEDLLRVLHHCFCFFLIFRITMAFAST